MGRSNMKQKFEHTGGLPGFLRKCRKALSAVLTVAMVAGAVQPALPAMTAHAESELPDATPALDNGASRRTAYVANGESFDLHGILFGEDFGTDGYDVNSGNPGAFKPYPFTGFSGGTTNGHQSITSYHDAKWYNFLQVVKKDNSAFAHGDSFWAGFGSSGGSSPSASNNGKVMTNSGDGIQFRTWVHPSPDGSMVFVDYTVQNLDAQFKGVRFGSDADIMIGSGNLQRSAGGSSADCAAIYSTGGGNLHMVNNGSADGTDPATYESFDFIANNSGLNQGITSVDSLWVGVYSNRRNHRFNQDPEHPIQYTGVKDTGMAYSWNVYLRPYEQVTRRVAFSAQGAGYYVNQATGSNSNHGTYDEPFKTLEHAIQKIGNKLGYVYVQGDYTMSAPITINASQNITIQTTDYDKGGTGGNVQPIPHDGFANPSTITAPNATEAFKVTGGSLTVQSIKINGASAQHTAFDVIGGKLSLGSGVSVVGSGTDQAVTASGQNGMGTALNIDGGKVSVTTDDTHPVKISGNGSSDRGLVNVVQDGGLELGGNVEVKGGKYKVDAATTVKRNIYLPQGVSIKTSGTLTGDIGVTIADIPAVYTGGAYQAPQERRIAKAPTTGSVQLPPAVFKSDDEANGLVVENGSTNVPGITDKDVVFHRIGHNIVYKYTDESGNLLTTRASGAITALPAPGTFFSTNTATPQAALQTTGAYTMQIGALQNTQLWVLAPQSLIQATKDTTAPGAATQAYEFKRAEVSMDGTPWTPAADGAIGSNAARVTMPDGNVTITYVYQLKKMRVTFHLNNGEADQIREGTPGAAIPGIPHPIKLGFNFTGWSETNGGALASPQPTNFPNGDKDYYALFQSTGAGFDQNVYYDALDGYRFKAINSQTPFGAAISTEMKHAYGYSWSRDDSTVTPASAAKVESGRVNGFNTAGNFSGTMPATNVGIRYVYRVNNAETTEFKVFYQDDHGNTIRTADTMQFASETQLSIPAPAINGFVLQDVQQKYGFTRSTDGLHDGLDGSISLNPNELYRDTTDTHAAANLFSGVMGNRKAAITFVYHSDGSSNPLVKNWRDEGTTDENLRKIRDAERSNPAFNSPVNEPLINFYGYNYANHATADPASAGAFTAGAFSGTMPNGELDLTWSYNRDMNLWKKVTFRAGAHGSLNNTSTGAFGTEGYVSSDVHPAGAGSFETNVLATDGTAEGNAAGYTLQVMKAKGLVPKAAADHLYQFRGWRLDANNDGVPDDADPTHLLQDDFQFENPGPSHPITLIAEFGEDPAHWGDIYFTAGEHGTIASTPASAHVNDEQQWSTVATPAATPEVNYLFTAPAGWKLDNTLMQPTSVVVPGRTYTASFRPDPDVFGIPTREVEAVGHINNGNRGKGQITVFHTDPNYQYVVTDTAGNIVAVQPGSPTNTNYFDDLEPETRYHVYEVGRNDPNGAPITPAVGQNISVVPASSKAGPKDVLIPAVETNYQVSYDDDADDGKVVLTINPADPDSDYAIFDKDGNLVTTPECGSDGWQTPAGTAPATVHFSGLTMNEEYRVVARPRNNPSMTPASRYNDGTDLQMIPAGELEIPKFIVETLGGGTIDTVNGASVGTTRFENAHAGETVSITAAATDSAGQNFLYWRVTTGQLEGVTGEIHARDYQFTMPRNNITITAYYADDPASFGLAKVTEEVNGGGTGEIALDPAAIPTMRPQLTTASDSDLITINHAKVEYRVKYNKNRVKNAEKNHFKNENPYPSHPQAFTGAWGLDVSVDRYVNGRRVNDTSVASMSNLTPFETYIQLNRDDVDQLDYKLWEIDPATGVASAVELTAPSLTGDIEQDGGLFHFTTKVNHRYVLTYSKAFRMTFVNNVDPKSRVEYKVRKGEAPADYPEFGNVPTPNPEYTDPATGVTHTYLNKWSRKEWPHLQEFFPDRPIRKRTIAYAYYKNDAAERQQTNDDLTNTINDALRLANDSFLRRQETQAVRDAIAAAQAVLHPAPDPVTGIIPAPNLAQLRQALRTLRRFVDDMENNTLAPRYNDYGDRRSGGSSGGSSGGGGGRGAGFTKNPFRLPEERNYVVGNNGEWRQNGDRTWQFVLNGGIPLRSTWGMLQYTSGDSSRTGWYHFNGKAEMDYGWFRDEGLNWFYCNTEHDGWFGKMRIGWYYDETDKHWYYLDIHDGKMLTGWQQINEKWYYLNPSPSDYTYVQNEKTGEWIYRNNLSVRPFGAMYVNETTPDGYRVGADGAWIQ